MQGPAAGLASHRPALLLFMLLTWGHGQCRASEDEAAPLSQLRAQVSGVEELLEEFRQQLQQQRQGEPLGGGKAQSIHRLQGETLSPEEAPGLHHLQGGLLETGEVQGVPQFQEEPQTPNDGRVVHRVQGEARRPVDVEQRGGSSMGSENNLQIQGDKQGLSHLQHLQGEGRQQLGEDGCEGRFTTLQDYIIRTKDSLAAGATFLAAPGGVSTWHQCMGACCEEPRCSVAVVELSTSSSHQHVPTLSCYLFDCIYRGHSVCTFSLHRGYNSFTSPRVNESATHQREPASNALQRLALTAEQEDIDEPPRSNAGQDVVLQLPTDWVILDGRESIDDHGIIRYEWNLLHGDPSLDMKVPQPGMLQVSHLQEGVYAFQLTVTDTAGQRSSDNITVTVLPMERRGIGCTGSCSRYQFTCDDGCCIDITLACDRLVQCPDGSDEAFCQNFGPDRKTVTNSVKSNIDKKTMELAKADKVANIVNDQQTRAGKQPLVPPNEERPELTRIPETKDNNEQFIPGAIEEETEAKTPPLEHAEPDIGSLGKAKETMNDNAKIRSQGKVAGGHPVPETGAVLPLALGLAITALLLLMVICRLRLVRQKLKKARPLTSEESDYLINGMYL
ncbi:low-density lipoprotein receptor-related protein 11 isoform X2 [Pleurodeles waltl]|uniref:low-density lipoprotein receptor-related protein 11 isoform X2 n=1 Tax=Pleurodeles waltl TaxID=8319 RepID=UPI0037096D56